MAGRKRVEHDLLEYPEHVYHPWLPVRDEMRVRHTEEDDPAKVAYLAEIARRKRWKNVSERDHIAQAGQ